MVQSRVVQIAMVFVCLISPAMLFADIIHMKNGDTVNCEIVEETSATIKIKERIGKSSVVTNIIQKEGVSHIDYQENDSLASFELLAESVNKNEEALPKGIRFESYYEDAGDRKARGSKEMMELIAKSWAEKLGKSPMAEKIESVRVGAIANLVASATMSLKEDLCKELINDVLMRKQTLTMFYSTFSASVFEVQQVTKVGSVQAYCGTAQIAEFGRDSYYEMVVAWKL